MGLISAHERLIGEPRAAMMPISGPICGRSPDISGSSSLHASGACCDLPPDQPGRTNWRVASEEERSVSEEGRRTEEALRKFAEGARRAAEEAREAREEVRRMAEEVRQAAEQSRAEVGNLRAEAQRMHIEAEARFAAVRQQQEIIEEMFEATRRHS